MPPLRRDLDTHLPESPILVDGGDADFGRTSALIEAGEPHGAEGHTFAESLRDMTTIRCTPGRRIGGTEDRRRRRGCPEEVVVPLLLKPGHAVRRAADDRQLVRRLAKLQVVDGSERIDQSGIIWDVTVSTGVMRRVPAALRITGSPSGNITVVQLIPARPIRFGVRRFIRSGISIVAELGDRLTAPGNPSICS